MKISRYVLAVAVIIAAGLVGWAGAQGLARINPFFGRLGYLLLGACLLLGIYFAIRIWPGGSGMRKASILRISFKLFLTIQALMLVPVLTLLCSMAGMMVRSGGAADSAAIGGGLVGAILGLILAVLLTILIWTRMWKKEQPVAGVASATPVNEEDAGGGRSAPRGRGACHAPLRHAPLCHALRRHALRRHAPLRHAPRWRAPRRRTGAWHAP